jgi:molybdate transport system ATP-binding protein
MAHEMIADFEKAYHGGPTIRAALKIPTGQSHVLVLFGPSGAGKTTILRCLAGLETPSKGRISFADQTWFDGEQEVVLSPQSRAIGYLFQDYALFPHLTVSQNITYALKGASKKQRVQCMQEMLHLFQLDGLADRWPGQLSGGQQQRVALARVLTRRPVLFLLDEPLSALDEPTRLQMRSELRRLLQGLASPTICVTHDPVEALTLADEVAVMGAGCILQIGSPDAVFSRPISAEVAAIVGVETVVVGTLTERTNELVALDVEGTRVWAVERTGQGHVFYLSIRAEDVILELAAPANSSARNHLAGKVVEIRPAGPVLKVVVNCGFLLTALVTRQAAQDLHLCPGTGVTATIKASAIHLIPRESGLQTMGYGAPVGHASH